MNIVLHLSSASLGGAEKQLLGLLREATHGPQQPYQHVVVLVREGPLADAFADTVPTICLHKQGKVDWRFVRNFRRLVREVQPAVIHAWGPTPNAWGATVPATLGPGSRPRTVLAEVSLDEWKGPLLRGMDRLAYSTSDRVVGCARAVTEAAIRRGAPLHKTGTIGLGVDLPLSAARQPERGLVLMLARTDWRKGHENLLDLWPSVLAGAPHARLIMAGPSNSESEILLREKVAAKIAADHRLRTSVSLLGNVDPAQYLARSEVLVVPSSSEGLPNVVLEAFSRRVPVVGYDVGGMGEMLTTGSTGWLVPPQDANGLARSLVQALNDCQEAQRRGDQGRLLVETMTFADALRQWTALYDDLLSRHAGSGASRR